MWGIRFVMRKAQLSLFGGAPEPAPAKKKRKKTPATKKPTSDSPTGMISTASPAQQASELGRKAAHGDRASGRVTVPHHDKALAKLMGDHPEQAHEALAAYAAAKGQENRKLNAQPKAPAPNRGQARRAAIAALDAFEDDPSDSDKADAAREAVAKLKSAGGSTAWADERAGELGLNDEGEGEGEGEAAPPPKPQVTQPRPAPQQPQRPTGMGWEPIPRTRHGGYRKRKPGGKKGYIYWYPGTGQRQAPHAEEPQHVHQGHAEAEAPPAPPTPTPEPKAKRKRKPRTAPSSQPQRTLNPDAPQQSELEREVESRNTRRQKHQDTGTVGGAHKHKRAMGRLKADSLSELEDHDAIEAQRQTTKANIIGTFDAAAAKERGDSPGTIMVKDQLWRSIAGKPAVQTPKGRQDYMEACQWFERQMDDLNTLAEVEGWLGVQQAMARGMSPADTISESEYNERFTAIKEVTYGGETRKIRTTDFDAMRTAGFATWASKTADGERQMYKDADPTVKQHMEDTRATLGKRFAGIAAKTRNRGGNYAAFWNKGVLDAARKADKAGDYGAIAKPKTRSGRTKKAIELERWKGDFDRRGGADVPDALSGRQMQDMFGLREMQWGQTVDDDRADAFLHQAASGMMDLADILGVDRSVVNMNGRLALAYGARGKGKALAHYEPSRVIINITKEKGAGSFAHEWAHFLDHQITNQWVPGRHFNDKADGGSEVTAEGEANAGDRNQFASHEPNRQEIHPEVQSAIREVMNAIHGDAAFGHERKALKKRQRQIRQRHREAIRANDYDGQQQAQRDFRAMNDAISDFNKRYVAAGRPKETPTAYAKAAKDLGSYWHKPHEMFARAFESYVEDKLRDQGRRNTFLVAGTRAELYPVDVYPRGEERTRIHAAFDGMLAAMRTHRTLEKALARIEALWAEA